MRCVTWAWVSRAGSEWLGSGLSIRIFVVVVVVVIVDESKPGLALAHGLPCGRVEKTRTPAEHPSRSARMVVGYLNLSLPTSLQSTRAFPVECSSQMSSLSTTFALYYHDWSPSDREEQERVARDILRRPPAILKAAGLTKTTTH